jgi:hypothetical protein
MKPYYYILNTKTQEAVCKINDRLEAQIECERIAANSPEVVFEILQCLGFSQANRVQTFWLDGVTPPHICNFHRLLNNECGLCGEPIE